MEPLHLTATESSPSVVLDPGQGIFEIKGESRPEDVRKFYEPILEWLDQYKSYMYWLKDNNPDAAAKTYAFTFSFEYFNSTSAKYILDMLTKLDAIKNDGFKIEIKWEYDQVDEDMKEAGEEYARLISVPFQFKAL